MSGFVADTIETSITSLENILKTLGYTDEYVKKHTTLFEENIKQVNINDYLHILYESNIIYHKPKPENEKRNVTNLEYIRTRAKELKIEDTKELQNIKDCKELNEELNSNFKKYSDEKQKNATEITEWVSVKQVLDEELKQLEGDFINKRNEYIDRAIVISEHTSAKKQLLTNQQNFGKPELYDSKYYLKTYASIIAYIISRKKQYNKRLSQYKKLENEHTTIDKKIKALLDENEKLSLDANSIKYKQDTLEEEKKQIEEHINEKESYPMNNLIAKVDKCFDAVRAIIISRWEKFNDKYSDFICPLTKCIIKEPICISANNHLYYFEKELLLEYFKTLDETKKNPLTNKYIGKDDTVGEPPKEYKQALDKINQEIQELTNQEIQQFRNYVDPDGTFKQFYDHKNYYENSYPRDEDVITEIISIECNISTELRTDVIKEITTNYWSNPELRIKTLLLLFHTLRATTLQNELPVGKTYSTGPEGYLHRLFNKLDNVQDKEKLLRALTHVMTKKSSNTTGGKQKTRRQKTRRKKARRQKTRRKKTRRQKLKYAKK